MYGVPGETRHEYFDRTRLVCTGVQFCFSQMYRAKFFTEVRKVVAAQNAAREKAIEEATLRTDFT